MEVGQQRTIRLLMVIDVGLLSNGLRKNQALPLARCRWNQKRGLNVRLFLLQSCHRGADVTNAGCWGGWVGSYLWAVWFVISPPLLYSVKSKRVVLGNKFQPFNRSVNAGAPRQ